MINGSSAAHQAAIRLQEHIQKNQILPGERLGREEELVALLGTSRTVVREALRILGGMHLVQIQRGPGGGVMVVNSFSGGVSQLVNQSIRDFLETGTVSATELLEARIAIEVPLAGTAARIAGEQMAQSLFRILEAGAQAAMENRDVSVNGAQFHQQIANLGMNRLVGGITSWMFDVLQPELERLQANRVNQRLVIGQHREIYDAIAAGEPESAEDAMLRHLKYLAESARLDVNI